MIETVEAGPRRIEAVSGDPRYYSGKYLKTICRSCRTTRPELRDLPGTQDGTFFERPPGLVEHLNASGAYLYCQLCSVEIPGSRPFVVEEEE